MDGGGNGRPSARWLVIYNQPMSDPVVDPTPDPASGPKSNPSPEAKPDAVPAQVAPPAPLPPQPMTNFHIGEEFGTAKRTLPPAGIVLICIAAVAIILGIFAFTERPKPQGAGSIDFATAADVPGQNMILAAITVTLRNTGRRPLWIHTLKAQLTTDDDKVFEDEAASPVDLDRYYQAFPALKESAQPPLSPETKLLAGGEQKGTMIVGFKVSKQAFDRRKSLTVSIQPYDQVLPIVLK
jgi:hypothetical protein